MKCAEEVTGKCLHLKDFTEIPTEIFSHGEITKKFADCMTCYIDECVEKHMKI